MADEDKPVTLGQLKALVGSGGNSGPTSGSAATPNTSGFAKGLKDVTEGALSVAAGFSRLTSGTDAATAGLSALSAGAKSVGLGTLGKGLDLFGGAILQQKQVLDKASAELGIGGNNIGLFVRMAGDAGLTTQQFTDVIKRADGSIGGLGLTAQQSALNFSKIQKNIVETGDQLNKMGLSAQEQADITALATINDAKRNANDKASQASIAKSAVDLAMSLDETAKITGQSRQAIMDSIKAEEKKPLAAIAMMQMDEKQRENYTQLQAQVQKLGPGFMSLSTEIATGGVQTKEGLAMLAAMGPEAANKYQAASQAMIDAKTPEEKKRAQALMDEAQAAVQRRMADEEFKRYLKSGTAEQQQAAANLVSGNKAMMSVQSEVQKNGGDYAKAIKDQREAVQATQAGLKVDEKTGKVDKDDKGNAIADEGQKVAQDLNGLNKAAALAAGGFAHSVEDANKSMAKTPAYVDAMNKAMQTISGGAKTIEGAQAAQKDKIGKGLNEIAGAAAGDGPTKPQKGAGSLPKDYEPTKKRAGGTLAETGSAVEPEDAVVKIHKGETVLNPDATKAMGKQLSAGSKTPGGVNFSEISKSVSTSISSMSGGGSTETKQIQNDSSKAAEKELAAVREQMQAEKNALREKLKAQMGDGSKLGGNAVAKEMRTGDEGKGIAEKYKAMMEPLQKQIDAGISFETTKKASAIEETKKVVEEQSKITFSGSIKQLEAFRSKEKAEDDFFGGTKKKTDAELADQTAKKDEIFKAAELARSVVGTSIKGLSDDAIKAMLPVSASMDDFYVDMNDNLQSFSNDSATNLQKITVSEKAASAAKNISSVPAATGAKSQAPVDDAAVNEWKKWIAKSGEFKADAERETAIKTTESIKARLADRQSQVAALEQTAAQRELTDKEKSDLAIAQSGVRRATNNLKDQETRMIAIDQLEKQGLAKTVETKKSEIAEVSKAEESKKATLAKSPSATAAAISPVPAALGANPADTGKGKGELEMVLSDYQKTVLKYAATEGEMKKVQLDNEKNIIRGTEAQITESKQRIANIQKDAEGRELTQREQNSIQKINEEIKGFEQQKATQKEALAVFENIDKLKAQTSTESKKAEVAEIAKHEEAKKATTASAKAAEIADTTKHEETKKATTASAKASEIADTTKHEETKKATVSAQQMFTSMATMGMTESQKKMFGEFSSLSKEDSDKKKVSLSEELASAMGANKAALAARDAIEEKAELEGRKMTEAEEAQRKALTIELNASANRIDAAADAQKVLGRSEEDRASQAMAASLQEQNAKEVAAFKTTQIAKDGAKEQENIQTTALAKTKANVNETLTINGKVVDPNSAEGKAALGKMEEAKAKMNQVLGGMMPDMSKMLADSKSLPGLDSLGKEISSGGVQSKEGLATMQAMGPEAATKFSNAVAAMQSATTADEKAKAKLQMDEAQASIAKRTQDKDFASMLTSGTKEQQEAAKALLQKSTVNQETKPSADSKGKTETTAKAVESHTIKAGETLSKIAKEAGISVQDIMKANPNIKDPNKIAAGASLNIPGAKKAEEAKPKTTEEKKPETDAVKKVEEAKPKTTEEKKPVADAVKKTEEVKPKATEEKKPVADAVKKTEEVKPKATEEKKPVQEKKPGEVGYVTEQANKLTSGFGNISAGNDMFNPKVVNKISDEEWAKIKEKQKSEGAPKASGKPGESAQASAAAPKTTAIASAPRTSDAAPKKEEPKKEEPKKAEPAKVSVEPVKSKSADPTMKDLNDQLVMLNRHMVELIKHSSATADASNKTAKNAVKSTGRAF